MSKEENIKITNAIWPLLLYLDDGSFFTLSNKVQADSGEIVHCGFIINTKDYEITCKSSDVRGGTVTLCVKNENEGGSNQSNFFFHKIKCMTMDKLLSTIDKCMPIILEQLDDDGIKDWVANEGKE